MDAWLQQMVFRGSLSISQGVDDRDLLLAPKWISFLSLSSFLKQKLLSLLRQIRELRLTTTVYPPQDRLMWWSHCCDPEDIKVVILGQDPYHKGQATGLAFSVDPQCQVPPSLRSIFRELEASVPNFSTPSHGCLDSWARQGVLLLNTVLTVEKGRAGSHEGLGWDWFTSFIISSISSKLEHCVFLLWGRKAIDRTPLINAQKHLVLTAQHPSPLASLGGRHSRWPRFQGCNHFNLANDYLTRHRRETVDWGLLEQ
nr:ORF46 [Human gammaherpesvirus 8]WPM02803.1 ORF46 [Human gammaherpesvirus 8]